jgi:uncharacterized protein (TIGR03435 family)
LAARALHDGDARSDGRPVQRAAVVDGTGLAGKYDVDFSWVRDGNAEAGPTLPIALQKQLGLKLEQKKGPVEMLVIDAADRTPAGN